MTARSTRSAMASHHYTPDGGRVSVPIGKRGQMQDYRDLFDRISNEKITIYENGRAICVRKPQLLATTIVDRGITGDAECEKILIMLEEPDLRPPAGVWHVESVDSEEEIPARQRALSI